MIPVQNNRGVCATRRQVIAPQRPREEEFDVRTLCRDVVVLPVEWRPGAAVTCRRCAAILAKAERDRQRPSRLARGN